MTATARVAMATTVGNDGDGKDGDGNDSDGKDGNGSNASDSNSDGNAADGNNARQWQQQLRVNFCIFTCKLYDKLHLTMQHHDVLWSIFFRVTAVP